MHSTFLKAACINQLTWSKDPLERALFGENCNTTACKTFAIDSDDVAETVGLFYFSNKVMVL